MNNKICILVKAVSTSPGEMAIREYLISDYYYIWSFYNIY